eukprot:CAMPEP_0118909254 /NCGR_PEP_ID=MMETSP1166-20130328/11911_1 /TAXON_ID=1104430 /ORGANISM="Chrysoreinhardia sp, Strain CCMP3193" /LENGTH=292 /DNA_ID=CAMNT_0006848673 /DNA_START=3 /DNA_END=881 /DNA_ORIENTATION=+
MMVGGDLFSPKVVVGLCAGVATFVATVATVVFLLVKGGSFERLRQELTSDAPAPPPSTKPRLRDDLLDAATRKTDDVEWRDQSITLSKSKGVETATRGILRKVLLVRRKKIDVPKSGEKKWGLDDPYVPSDLWHPEPVDDAKEEDLIGIFDGDDCIGAIALLDHRPRHLGVRLRIDWLHPAYFDRHSNKRTLALVALFAALAQLFDAHYRRVEWLCDVDDTQRRSLATALGFHLEGILRKHIVFQDRSRDSALYSILNSDWFTNTSHTLRHRLRSPLLAFLDKDDDDDDKPP